MTAPANRILQEGEQMVCPSPLKTSDVPFVRPLVRRAEGMIGENTAFESLPKRRAPGSLAALAAMMCILLLILAAPQAYGQAFGTISGSVTDPSGAGVPGAKVTATETLTGFSRSVTSGSSGDYVIPNLRPTQYTMTVEAKGFKRAIQTGITLLANQAATVDIRLQLGSTVQTVSVVGTEPLVNTTTQTLSDVVGRDRMVGLPLNGRNAVQLMNLVAGASGVSPATTTSQSTLPGSTNANINGSRDNQTSYALDGANYLDQYYNVNIPFPFPDALQEFSVQTDNYSARYGENAGGVVNVVTKSGGNQFHGDLFEFVRNPIFNARNFFSVSRDKIKRNQFGGTIGGPVIIPHVYNGHDRTFFFFGYQGERYRDVSTSSAFVPTTAELTGDFSALLSASNPDNPFGKAEQIDNPWPYTVGTTAPGKPFPGNIIPANALDPAALKIAEDYLPQASGTGRVFYTHPTVQNINQVILRLDHRLGANDTLTGRWYKDHVVFEPQNPPGNLLGYSAGYDQPVNNVMIQETHTFRSNLLNQASFTFSNVPTEKVFASNSPDAATFGVKGLWLPTTRWIQNISAAGAFSISGGALGPFNNKDYGVQDNLSWVVGRHNIDLGASFDHSIVNLGDQFLSQGSFNFNASVTNNALASFLLGYMNNFRQGYGEYKNNRNNFWAFYFNDSFHATRRLTLNYGLRYEPYTPWKEIQGRAEQFRINNFYAGVTSQKFPNAPPGLLFPGDPSMPFDGVTGNYTDFAPRAGFAYDLSGNGKTSIRGGAGFFYDSGTAGVINNRFADISPFSPQVSLTPPPGPFSDPLQGYTGYYPFPFTYPPASNTPFSLPDLVITYDPSTKYMVPVTYQWDLAVERELARNWMLQVAYVGSVSRHQKETIELNPARYIPGSKLGTDARRLFAPDYGSISMDGQDVNANFNALEVTLKKRLARHLSLTTAYTYSKALDDCPNGCSNNDIGSDSASALPWYFAGRHQFDYGPSGFDHTHRLVVSYVWMLPAFSSSNRFTRGVLGDWEWSGIATAQSGGAFTITAGKDQSQTGLNQDRGVQVAGVNPFVSGPCQGEFCVSYLNKAAFTEPAVGTFGTLAKDSFRGPSLFSWDMGMFKNVALTERFQLQFRAEFFNVFNKVNFNNPNGSVSAGGFGTITGASDPRIGQLALKLIF
jgi:hypothetical protein